MPRRLRSRMAATTASSVGVRRATGAIEVESRASMYQVTSTPAQFAFVAVSCSRESWAAPYWYSSCHQDTWLSPRYVKPEREAGSGLGEGPDEGLSDEPQAKVQSTRTGTRRARGISVRTGP